jgi:hypothetical protein
MASEYPYMISNNKIGPILESIKRASKPQKFTHNFLQSIGYSSTNDRAIIPLLKKLSVINEDGTPTEYYDQLRDQTLSKKVLANRIKDLYAELFTINTEIQKATDEEIKGALSRVTGKDEEMVTRYFNTFKTLCDLADFSNTQVVSKPKPDEVKDAKDKEVVKPHLENPKSAIPFHYNIQIHLPATTDISVYNAIFKSLKENLL